jgi:hypothetical protein
VIGGAAARGCGSAAALDWRNFMVPSFIGSMLCIAPASCLRNFAYFAQPSKEEVIFVPLREGSHIIQTYNIDL